MISMTCYHIISKIVEVEPIDLNSIKVAFCHNKFTSEQFNETEAEIFSTLICEIETPHVLEFALYYFKVLRFYLQVSPGEYTGAEVYLSFAESLAKNYVRMIHVDLDINSHRPSFLGAAAVYYGVLYSSHFMTQINEQARHLRRKIKVQEQDAHVSLQAWHLILVKLLEISPSQMQTYLTETMKRAAYIHLSEKQQLRTIFPEEMHRLLPPYDSEWVRCFSDII